MVYGWWLPNDPRGSTSRAIASDVIAELGTLHFGRKKIQPPSRGIRSFYERASDVLKHPLLELSVTDRAHVATAFSSLIDRRRYTCYACAIMPDHVHILIRKHRDTAEEMIYHLQMESAVSLTGAALRETTHPVWAQGGWKGFLDSPDDIWRTVSYIRNNPAKARLADQNWLFVTPYNNWPLHEGHHPDSPYARGLQGR